jgi:peptidylprolyl isomerase/peptidyl-prolyl cis-trans isomerase D
MAILNSIRKRGIFLIVIIALALFSFVLSGVIGNGNTSVKGESNIATINGVDITREDFMKKVETTQRSLGSNSETNRAMDLVWQREMRRVILEEQYQSLGLGVESSQINNALSINLANNTAFQNDLGLFDEGIMQEYIASAKASAETGNPQVYQSWLDYEVSTVNAVLETNYFDLVKGGLITTLADGEQQYHFENDKINIEFVQIPYSKIADADVAITNSEIENYIKSHAKEFEVEPLVDIQYITYLEDPSTEDIEVAKAEINALLLDKVVDGETIQGFANTTKNIEYANANSELGYIDVWWFKNTLPQAVADTIITMNVNEVYGPYEDKGTLNLSKVIETRQMADSAKAKHILIRYEGLQTAPQDVIRTRENAKALADSILNVVNRNKGKFESLAAGFSEDLSNKDNGGDLGYFTPGRMVKTFNDFVFENKIGDVGVVETDYGFHVIEIEDQKNIQKAIKVASIIKKIEPSEKTINEVFSKATRFELAVKDGDFNALANEDGLAPKPVNKIGELDANIPGIGNNRGIVTWAFNEETKIGDVRRFNITNGYVLAQLTRRNPKGLLSIAEASATVSPILRNEKKAIKIRALISSSDINEVATNQNVSVLTADAVTMSNPTIAGAGTEPKVVGAAFGKKVNETTNLIDGVNGVYMVRVLEIINAPDIQDYTTFANQLNAQTAPSINTNVFNALKNAAVIEDNRAEFY